MKASFLFLVGEGCWVLKRLSVDGRRFKMCFQALLVYKSRNKFEHIFGGVLSNLMVNHWIDVCSHKCMHDGK